MISDTNMKVKSRPVKTKINLKTAGNFKYHSRDIFNSENTIY